MNIPHFEKRNICCEWIFWIFIKWIMFWTNTLVLVCPRQKWLSQNVSNSSEITHGSLVGPISVHFRGLLPILGPHTGSIWSQNWFVRYTSQRSSNVYNMSKLTSQADKKQAIHKPTKAKQHQLWNTRKGYKKYIVFRNLIICAVLRWGHFLLQFSFMNCPFFIKPARGPEGPARWEL